MTVRVGIFNTHPIQYQAPIWRRLAQDGRFRCTVFFLSDQGLIPRVDPGFGQPVAWDVPLVDGYDHRFLARAPIAEAYRMPIPGIDDLLRRERFDIVMMHGYRHAYCRQLIRHRRRGGYKVVVRGEFSDLLDAKRPAWQRLARRACLSMLYRRIDVFSSIGTDAAAHLRRHCVGDDRIFLAPYCVDDETIDRQRGQFPRDAARASLGVDADQCLVLFSGKLIPRKQPLMLAEAIARLPDPRRITVCYVGSGTLAAAVEARLRPVLGSRLLMPGFVNQSQLGRYFAAADLFVLPTAHDTWGLVVNEAMHWGLPCVVSDRAGCARDLIIEGRTGFTHVSHDVAGLSELVARLAADPVLRSRMGAEARLHAEGFRSAVTANALGDTFACLSRRLTAKHFGAGFHGVG
jgi:glycosyltransferase involved in cell wall biosynthesis